MISVIILGAGNVATHLYKAFSKSDTVLVKQWYNRTRASISSYANEVAVTDKLNEFKEADIYILAVSDDSISQLSSDLPFSISPNRSYFWKCCHARFGQKKQNRCFLSFTDVFQSCRHRFYGSPNLR